MSTERALNCMSWREYSESNHNQESLDVLRMKVMIAVFLGLVIDEDCGVMWWGDSNNKGQVGANEGPNEISPVDVIRSDSQRMVAVRDSDSSLGAPTLPGATGGFVSVPDHN